MAKKPPTSTFCLLATPLDWNFFSKGPKSHGIPLGRPWKVPILGNTAPVRCSVEFSVKNQCQQVYGYLMEEAYCSFMQMMVSWLDCSPGSDVAFSRVGQVRCSEPRRWNRCRPSLKVTIPRIEGCKQEPVSTSVWVPLGGDMLQLHASGGCVAGCPPLCGVMCSGLQHIPAW